MTKLRATLLLLPFAVFLGGCPIYGGGGGGGRIDGGPLPCVGPGCICDTDADCSGTLVCGDEGFCEAPPAASCRTHGDCDRGAYCDDASRTCTPSSTCSSDSDCEADFLCDFRSTCVPRVPGACRDGGDCSDTQACVEGRCRATTDTCQFNYQCGGGRGCVNNACVDICTGDADCESGQACTGGFCRPTSECTSSATCGRGEHCVGGRCLPDCETSTTSCTAEEYCAEDAFCRPSWEPTPFCSTDEDCAATSVCVDGVCRTPCPTGTNDECLRFDVQLPICAMDNFCYSTNETMPECVTSVDCGMDRSCIDGICRN